MKLNKILSSELPDIDNSIKECVNSGEWFLFKPRTIQQRPDETAFYLKAGSKIFLLNKSGQILKIMQRENLELQMDELFYFSDIAQPHSLSNIYPSTKQ